MELNNIFVEAVKERIYAFNETRGKRKELAPEIVEDILLPNRKYGHIIDLGDTEMSEIISRVIPRMAEVTVRTLLRLKPRPFIITVGMFEYTTIGGGADKYLFRFKIPSN